MERKENYELQNKVTELRDMAIDRIKQLETEQDALIKDSKTWQYQINRIHVDLNNKRRRDQWTWTGSSR